MKVKIKTPDGFILDAVFLNVKDSNKAVILAHGMTVSKDDEGIFVKTEPKLNDLGFSTLRFDFRAHGKSSGDSVKDFTISGELTDLESTFKFLEGKGFQWFGLAGASFGGSISALYAGRNPEQINKLFLANPVLDYDKTFLNPITPWAMKTFFNFTDKLNKFGFIEEASRKFKMGKPLMDEMSRYNPCKELNKYKNPLFVAHGDRDDKVSLKHVRECFNNLDNKQKEFKLIKGSGHGFDEEPFETDVVEMIINFFNHN